jgi:predicted DNA-binding protein YlxM (UPF0122 family)
LNSSQLHNNYNELQKNLDLVIGKIGVNKTIRLLEGFLGVTSDGTAQKDKVELITTFIITRSISRFNLDMEEFYSCPLREYREGRMTCYHLIKKYTDLTFAKIAEDFNTKKRNVIYSFQKCEDMLSVPQFHKAFTDRYTHVEQDTLDFVTKINF